MAKHLVGEKLAKARKLNPYRRINRGNTVNITVDEMPVEGIVDNAGKYSYLTVEGTEYYISDVLVEGAAYVVEDIVPMPKKAKKAKAPETEAEVAPSEPMEAEDQPKAEGRRSRRPTAA